MAGQTSYMVSMRAPDGILVPKVMHVCERGWGLAKREM